MDNVVESPCRDFGIGQKGVLLFGFRRQLDGLLPVADRLLDELENLIFQVELDRLKS